MKQNKQKSKRLDHECHPGPLKLPELPLLFLRIETKYSFLCCSKIVHQAFSYDCIFTAGNYLSLTALLGMKMKNIIGNVFYLYYHYCLTPFFCFNFRVKHLIYSHAKRMYRCKKNKKINPWKLDVELWGGEGFSLRIRGTAIL